MKSRLLLPFCRRATTLAGATAMLATPNAMANSGTWTQTAGGAQNWTTGTNWSGGSAPTPVSGDTVDFSNVDLLANTTLTLGGDRTATTWRFGDTSGAQTWTVSGNKLTLAGAGATLEVGTATTISSVLAVANGTTATATGSGALTLDTSNFALGGTSSNTTQTLDLSGLGSFTYNNSGGTFSVGGQLGGNVTRTIGTLTLSANSAITASTFGVANQSNGGNNSQTNNTNLGTLNLTGSTTINTRAITVGANQANGTVQYASGTTNPILTIRGTNGSGPATTMLVGQGGGNGNGYTTTSIVDLVTGVTGTSTLEASLGTLTIGHCNRASTATNNGGTVNGTFTMGAGTLTATTMVLGSTTTFGNTSNSQTVNGTFTTGAGGVVKVATLKLVDQINTTGYVKLNGTFNLNGGADLYAGSIQPGSTTSGTVTRSFNWNDGTIHNYDALTDLTMSVGPTWTLASTGTHAFDIDNGRAATLNAVLAGTGGTLTKKGLGTLALGAADRISNSIALSVTDGTFDLGGYSETVAAVSMSGGSISNGTLTGTSYNFTDGGSVSANLAGSGVNLTKSGAGTLTISSSDNTYSGTTSVSGTGTLVVDGNISASSLTTIGNGATLEGVGTVGALTIYSGAFHNPGNSPGIMNTGNYTMDGTLTTEINGLTPGITGYDQVNVTGTVNLSGSLVAAFGGGGYASGNLIFILLNDSDDAIIGTFAGLAQGATVTNYGKFDWIISYTGDFSNTTSIGGNDIVLMAQTAIPEPAAPILGSIGMLLLLRRRRVA